MKAGGHRGRHGGGCERSWRIRGWCRGAPINDGSLVGERGPQVLYNGHPVLLAKDAADRRRAAGVRRRAGLVDKASDHDVLNLAGMSQRA